MLTVDAIAKILGAPRANVVANWPLIQAALVAQDIGTPMVEIAALATLGAELPSFRPQQELSPRDEDRGAYFVRMYWDNMQVRYQLGNLSPDDAVKYCGRGFIQLTGRSNYQIFGDRLGLDLINRPELALDAHNAAQIFAAFFKDRHVADAANAAAWRMVRKRVNGGFNNWPRFEALVQALLLASSADRGGHAVG